MGYSIETGRLAFPSTAADQDPLVAHVRELEDKQAVCWALADDELTADDSHRLADVCDLATGELELARRRVETTPPTSLRGLALQIGYALDQTDSPATAAALRSCLIALGGEAYDLVPPVFQAACLEFMEDPIILGLQDRIFDGQT